MLELVRFLLWVGVVVVVVREREVGGLIGEGIVRGKEV